MNINWVVNGPTGTLESGKYFAAYETHPEGACVYFGKETIGRLDATQARGFNVEGLRVWCEAKIREHECHVHPIGTVTKANYRPCNCMPSPRGEHSPRCHSREIEVTIGTASPVPTMWDVQQAEKEFGDCLLVREMESKARRCTCGTKDGKHSNTCGVLAAVSPKVERARPVADLFAVDLDTGTFKGLRGHQFDDLIAAPTSRAEWLSHLHKVCDPLLPMSITIEDVLAAVVGAPIKPATLEWLARELRLKPNADDETIKATTRLRLAGQFEELATAKSNNAILGAELLASNERVERALCEIADERQENDTLRGMVAEVQLENKRLQRKGGAL
ncbi:MAG: hypothetical protein WC563_15230 [Brevundimonas sp.]